MDKDDLDERPRKRGDRRRQGELVARFRAALIAGHDHVAVPMLDLTEAFGRIRPESHAIVHLCGGWEANRHQLSDEVVFRRTISVAEALERLPDY